MRLTNHHRDIIIERLREQRFGKQERELIKEKKDFADKVYEDLYPLPVRRLMEKLPKGFFGQKDSLCVSVGGQCHWVTMSGFRLVVYQAPEKHYTSTDPLGVEYFELFKKERTLNEERDLAICQARAVLNSVTTLKQLLDVWPEVKPFVADFGKVPVTTKALAVSISELNKRFGFGAK